MKRAIIIRAISNPESVAPKGQPRAHGCMPALVDGCAYFANAQCRAGVHGVEKGRLAHA
jgi:hypothetical protein